MERWRKGKGRGKNWRRSPQINVERKEELAEHIKRESQRGEKKGEKIQSVINSVPFYKDKQYNSAPFYKGKQYWQLRRNYYTYP